MIRLAVYLVATAAVVIAGAYLVGRAIDQQVREIRERTLQLEIRQCETVPDVATRARCIAAMRRQASDGSDT